MAGLGKIVLDGAAEVGLELMLQGEAFGALRLWRARPGEALTLADGAGRLFRARLVGLEDDGATLKLFEAMEGVESGPEVTLLQALTEKERMELIIQKTTELGVAAIAPFESDKSISLVERDARQKKSHKWAEVALKAAKQCRRTDIPELLPCTTFEGALASAGGAALRIMLREGGRPIREVLGQAGGEGVRARRIFVMSGPEGGFSDPEVERAEAAGFTPVALGPWVLRAETAPVAAMAVIGARA